MKSGKKSITQNNLKQIKYIITRTRVKIKIKNKLDGNKKISIEG
jgi:hypothetical protein